MVSTIDNHLAAYRRDGYLVARGLFSQAEIDDLAAHYAAIADGPSIDNHWTPDRNSDDPLRQFPRVMHPHRFDAVSKQWLIDPRVWKIVTALLEEEPLAVQSMYYFKPPGAKGQALHQDDFYLKTRPAACLAAWTAVDPSIPSNGGLHVVPLTHTHDVVCPQMSNPDESFTTHYVPPPDGSAAVPVELQPGDTLFFNGCVIHGSKPNSTTDLWRRSFICHYVPASSATVSQWFMPGLDRNGNELRLPDTQDGGPCGEEFPAFFNTKDARAKP